MKYTVTFQNIMSGDKHVEGFEGTLYKTRLHAIGRVKENANVVAFIDDENRVRVAEVNDSGVDEILLEKAVRCINRAYDDEDYDLYERDIEAYARQLVVSENWLEDAATDYRFFGSLDYC